ncbi:C-type natriuretic peptide 2-like [Salarias fasciatus]|uniref:C-type natriuretic peptide 2-like n=1 Tax=Salarias fasciatus TaxID=181472 RepID=A0A672FM15_SALFA|nr:C-type natriuretic peptide 2-like [Salarias fasciatus]
MAATLTLLILLFITVVIETKPSPQQDEQQVLRSLFGSHLSALIVATPLSDDIREGSGVAPAPLGSGGQRRGAVPDFFLDVLRRQTRMQRRGRKSTVGGGGRGCFGMKMDRIGSVSGLGC